MDWFDLDSGTVESDCHVFPCSGNEDFHFAYNSNAANPVVLFQNQQDGREIAFLDGRPFGDVGPSDLTGANWTSDLVGQSFDPDDTILIRTDQGFVFKVGAAGQINDAVSFCYEALCNSTLSFETDWFDLDDGTVEGNCHLFPCSGNEDFQFAYNSNAANPVVLAQNQQDGREVAFLDGRPFADVGLSDLAGANWTSDFVDQSFDPDDTILIRTDQGFVFKVGVAVQISDAVNFCYARIIDPSVVPTPPAATFSLSQNAPNPFNPSTMIRFDLPQAGTVELTIYDVAGRRVRTLVQEVRNVGSHDVIWRGVDDSGRQVASGVYLYRLEAGSYVETRLMTLIK